MQKFAYVRIPRIAHSMNRQVAALQAYGIDRWFIERLSETSSLKQLSRLLITASPGDEIYDCDFSRIASTAKELLDIIEFTQVRQLRLISLKENFDSGKKESEAFVFAVKKITELERSAMIEQTHLGIAQEQLRKTYNHDAREKITYQDFKEKYKALVKAGHTKTQIAKILGISRERMYQLIRSVYREEKRYK